MSTKRALANSTIFVFGDLGIEAPLEIGERLHDGDAGLFEPTREESIRASSELVFHEQFEKLEMG